MIDETRIIALNMQNPRGTLSETLSGNTVSVDESLLSGGRLSGFTTFVKINPKTPGEIVKPTNTIPVIVALVLPKCAHVNHI